MLDVIMMFFLVEFNKRMVLDFCLYISYYVNINVIIIYVIWVNSWYGYLDNVMVRMVVFLGEEKLNECMYNYQGVIIIINSLVCQVIIVFDFLIILLLGWKLFC